MASQKNRNSLTRNERIRPVKKVLANLSLLLVLGLGAFVFSWTPAHANLSEALVGHWEFGEGTGTTTADSSTEGNNGTLVQNGSSPAWVSPGRDGTGFALQFNGAGAQAANSNTVNVGNDASLNGLSRYILSAWVKFDPGYVGNGGTWANIIGRTQGSNFSYMLYINANGHLRAHHVQSNGGVILYDSADAIPTGQWVHIAQIADGSRIRLIVNGIEDPTSAAYDGTANSLPTANTYIGQDTRETTLLGTIDDVAIYDNFAAPGGVAGGLTAWQKANDGTATGALWSDSSGNGNDAIQASASVQPTFLNNGINFNPALNFDGSNDFFAYSNSLGVAGTSNFSSLVALRPDDFGTTYSFFGNNGGIGNNFLFTLNTAGAFGVGRGGNSTGPSCAATTTTTISAGVPGVGSYTRLTGTQAKVELNGGGDHTGSCATNFAGTNRLLGRRVQSAVSGGIFDGAMGEFIHYNRTLTDAELSRIQSYLAIKYGITLDQAAPQDYVASDGTTIPWSAATNGIYKHNITGIGRDDNSALNQKQSRSQNLEGIVTVGHNTIEPTNIANTNDFSADKTFLTFGDDNNSAATWADTGVTNTTLTNYQRLPRTWKVQETSTVGIVTVGLDTTDPDANVPDATSGYYLLRDSNNNGSFADETPIQMTDSGSGQFSVNGINFDSGELFTFATLDNEYRVDILPVDNLTGEDGDTGTFKVKLGARPSAAVTITFTSSNTDEGTVPVSITIQPDDWDDYDANAVTVTGVDDSPPVGDGAVPYTIVTTDVTSADTNFNVLGGGDVGDVAMFNQNNDPPGINVSLVSTNITSETESCVDVQFVLLSQPTGAVTIPLSIDDTTEGTLSGVNQITIQSADWDQPQNNEVTICGVADGTVDGDIPYNLITGDPTSGDAGYNGINATQVADVALVNQNIDTDDDGDGIQDVEEDGSPNSGDANEDGTADRLQRHVTSFVSAATGDYATLEIDDTCQIISVNTAAEAGQTFADPDYEYPYGLMNFQADCGTPGFTATVQHYYFGASEDNLILRKYNSDTKVYFTINNTAIEQLTVGGETLAKVTFQVQDGGNLDMDGSADGTITDPAGLALQVQGSNSDEDGELANTGQSIVIYSAVAALLIATSLFVYRRKRA